MEETHKRFFPAKPASAGVAGFKLVVCVSKNCNRPTDRPKKTHPPFMGADFKKQLNFVLSNSVFEMDSDSSTF